MSRSGAARRGGQERDLAELLVLGVLVVTVVAVLPAATAAAGAVSGLLSGRGWGPAPYGSWPAVLVRLPVHRGDPAGAFPAAVAGHVGPAWRCWLLVVLVVGVAVAALGVGLVWVTRPWRRPPGYATGADLARVATAAAVLRAAPPIRPDLTGPAGHRRRGRRGGTGPEGDRGSVPAQVASFLGVDAHTGTRLYRGYNSNCAVIGPTQVGKTAMLVGQVLEADGPVVVTSTRGDLLWRTAAGRRRRGGAPALVGDPDRLSGWPDPLRWDPVRGCEDPGRAQLRARALVAGARVGDDVTDGGAWQEIAAEILAYYLHAAALGGRSMREVLAWSANPADETPQDLLRVSPVGTGFWGARLAGHAQADPRLVSNMWFGVRLALNALTQPAVLHACCPQPGEGLDVRAFLAGGGSLYVLGSAAQQASVAPLITALVEDVVETARRTALASPWERLSPPLHLFLDEVANIAPLPTLPSLLSDGAGVGISVTIVAQSPAQLQDRWGEKAAQAIWDNATTKVLFGGSAYPDALEDISRLCGEYDEPYEVRTRSGFFRPEQASTSVQVRQRRVVPVEVLYTLPPLTALLLLRATRPVQMRVVPWWERADADLIRDDETALKAGRRPTPGDRP